MKRVFSVGVMTLAALALRYQHWQIMKRVVMASECLRSCRYLDKDESGTISLSEFQMPEGRDAPDMRMDLNDDGTISRDEVAEAISQHSGKGAGAI